MGLLFAGVAVLSWGIGDFLIQRSTRRLGDWETLFFITAIATIVLFPFSYGTLASLGTFEWLVLTGTSTVILFAAILDLEALRVGKIAVIAPIDALEVPITIALATFLLGEALTPAQLILVVALIAGTVLISNKQLRHVHKKTIERGVWTAVVAAVGMGVSNFLFGFASRATDPLLINWFTSAFMAATTLAYLLFYGRLGRLIREWRDNKKLILTVGTTDNLAWVAYSASTLYLPIGIATGITESYIALAALLGLVFNRERLRLHQFAGLVLTLAAAVTLGFLVS